MSLMNGVLQCLLCTKFHPFVFRLRHRQHFLSHFGPENASIILSLKIIGKVKDILRNFFFWYQGTLSKWSKHSKCAWRRPTHHSEDASPSSSALNTLFLFEQILILKFIVIELFIILIFVQFSTY